MYVTDIIVALARAEPHQTVSAGLDGLEVTESPAALIGALGVSSADAAVLVAKMRTLLTPAERAAYARGAHDLMALLRQ